MAHRFTVDGDGRLGRIAILLRTNVEPILVFLGLAGIFLAFFDFCEIFHPLTSLLLGVAIGAATIVEVIFGFSIHITASAEPLIIDREQLDQRVYDQYGEEIGRKAEQLSNQEFMETSIPEDLE